LTGEQRGQSPDRSRAPERRALTGWYNRNPKDLEAEREAAAQRKHEAFVASIREAQRRPAAPALRAPLDMAGKALRDFQEGPDIPRPSLAQSFIPVVGPAWEAAANLQDGNYAGAVFNGAMAVADVLPVGFVTKGARAATKGITVLKNGSVSANAAAKQMRAKGLAGPGEEIHHTIALKGKSRTAQDPRNHYALLKVLPTEQHRRLTGSWKGKPRYDPVRRVWYGTTDWQKAAPTALAGYAADSWENVTRPFGSSSSPRR
jgi:hypothetical protein